MKYTLFLSLMISIALAGLQAQTVHNVCPGDTLEFSISVTTGDQVQWQQSIDGVSFYDIPGAVQDHHTIPGVSQTRYYRSRITGQNCDPWYSDVQQIMMSQAPVLGFTGIDSSYCETSSLATLTGNPAGGTFSGTGVTGNTFDPGVSGVGTFYITYHYTDTVGCTYTITAPTTVYELPTTANAGPDIVATSDTVTLSGNNPSTGSGLWSVISGSGGSFAANWDPSTTFTGNPNEVYLLVWSISSGPCPPSTDTVMVTMPTGPSLPSIMCGSPAYTLYVHPTDNGSSAWGCSGIVAGASSDDDGAGNTALIVQMCPQGSAASICDNLVAYGYSDWYLPSYNELECLRANESFIGGFVSGGYWSSTEGSGILTSNAKMRNFPSGMSGHSGKSNVHNIRCVRKDTK